MNIADTEQKIQALRHVLNQSDAVIVGAGAGLSASAGYDYTGERFQKYFRDFSRKYGFSDMYSGGFYPFDSPEEYWAYWSRYIYINRYMKPQKPVYQRLYEMVKNKDYFILTTNVDHCFQKAGFDKRRLFYTQGDYGLFQCSGPCCQKTYDNKSIIQEMLRAQGFVTDAKGTLDLPKTLTPEMAIPSELIPHCPKCGRQMTMNLRADNTFAKDAGWHKAAGHYKTFLKNHRTQQTLFLELGVGMNTPGIIKYPFWRMTAENPRAAYACINYGPAVCPQEIKERSICINGDIGEILREAITK